MVKREKRRENEKGERRNGGWVRWRENRRRMERGKLWISVWMRENGVEREANSWRRRDKEWENNQNLNFFK